MSMMYIRVAEILQPQQKHTSTARHVADNLAHREQAGNKSMVDNIPGNICCFLGSPRARRRIQIEHMERKSKYTAATTTVQGC